MKMVESMISKKKRSNFKKTKRKIPIVIEFDENSRREFITGFHKRKMQRKQKALEEFEKNWKAEKKRIKTETKDMFKKLLLTQKSVPSSNVNSRVIDMGTHSVTVTELSATELAKSNNWIGVNETVYEKRKIEWEAINTTINSESEEVDLIKQNNALGQKTSFKNHKDLKKHIKQQATLNVKNSEIFKKKTKIEKIRQIKKKKKEEKKRKKLKRQKEIHQ